LYNYHLYVNGVLACDPLWSAQLTRLARRGVDGQLTWLDRSLAYTHKSTKKEGRYATSPMF